MVDDLLEKWIIQLAEPKRVEEVRRTTDSNCCRHHRMVIPPLKNCIMIKELIMQLAKEWRIILDLDNVVKTNHISY